MLREKRQELEDKVAALLEARERMKAVHGVKERAWADERHTLQSDIQTLQQHTVSLNRRRPASLSRAQPCPLHPLGTPRSGAGEGGGGG